MVRGWLGVEIKDVDEVLASQFGLDRAYGVLVNKVLKGMPAEKGGLKRGDIIISFNGKKVQNVREFQKNIAGTKPKTKVKIGVIRDKKRRLFEVVLGEMPGSDEVAQKDSEEAKQKDAAEWMGMKVANFEAKMAESYGLPEDEQGVVVIDIDPRSHSARAGILEGDLIRAINQMPTTNIGQFEKVTSKADRKKGVVFDINRKGILLFITYSSR